MGPPPASPEQKPRLRAGAAAARGFRPPRGCASCSNTRARYIRAPHKRDPLGRNPLAATSFATMAFFASAGHFFWYAGAGIDEATDIQVAKDAAVRGSGASRPWMACARLLEPGTAESGDAPDPRTAAAPPEAENSSALRPHCRGSTRSQWTPAHFDLAGSGIPQLGEEPKKERGPRPALPDRTTRGERPAVQNLRFCAQ